MGQIKSIHSYAKQLLARQGIKIYADGKEILPGKYVYERYPIPAKVTTRIKIGSDDFKPSEEIIIIRNHQKLVDLGLKIISKNFTQWFRGQKQRYDIVRAESVHNPLREIPKEHYVEFDLVNRAARLKGKNANWNGVGPWVFAELIVKKKDTKIDPITKYLDDHNKLIGRREKDVFLEIPELPVGISEDGKIICIEQEKNEPGINISGMRRMGNTLFMHGMLDRAYHIWKKLIYLMNDGFEETDTWCLPWQEHPSEPNLWIRELKKFDNPSLPMPCVYLTPDHQDVIEEDVVHPKEIGFKTSWPYKDMIMNWSNVLKGNERWMFHKALIYFNSLIYNEDGTKNEDMCGATSFEEIHQVMLEKWCDEKGKVLPRYENVYMKCKETMFDIWNARILDISNKVPSKWKVSLPNGKEYELDPAVACLMCGLVPVIMTKKIKSRPHFPQEFKYRLEQIFNAQVENEFFKGGKKQVWLAIDELQSFAATDNKTVASETLERVANQSGPNRIGFVYRTQNWNKAPSELRNGTSFCFAFKQNNESAKAIVKHFNADRSYVGELTALKKFQFIAFTTNRFVVYDPTNGNKEFVSDKPIKGKVIPPMSWHKPPKEEGVS